MPSLKAVRYSQWQRCVNAKEFSIRGIEKGSFECSEI